MATGYIPIFEIYKGGENITARFQDRAMSIVVELAAGNGSQDTCDITLDDREYLIATPRVKDRLDVYLGYEGIGVTYMGSYEINSVRFSLPPRQIQVRGTAVSALNQVKSQRIKEYEGKTVQQVLTEAASETGINVKVHPSIGNQKIPFLNQSQSFGSLVGRLESLYDGVAKFTADGLSLMPRGEGRSVSDIALPSFVLTEEHFADLEVLQDSRGETAKTSASYYDKDTHKRTWIEAKSKLRDLDTDAEHLVGTMFNSKEEAEKAAESVQAQLDRSTGKIAATLAEGNPWVRDGQRLVIAGIRDGVDGSYLLDIVRHQYTKGGALRTSFTGSAGTAGLLEAFQNDGASDEFIVPPPGMIVGEVLPTLPKSSGAVPAFTDPTIPFPLTIAPSSALPRTGGSPAPSNASELK